jgi:chromosome segregation ATPase
MMDEPSAEVDSLLERAEAALEKFRERADVMRDDLGDAKAATKVRMKAMIARLDAKYDRAKDRLSELKQNGASDEIEEFHQKIVSELADMKRTVKRWTG